jgi:cysteine desulfurase/selenocysteine lyase
VSNLDGVVIPAKEIIGMLHSRGAIAMLDAAQSVPHMKVDVQALGVDLMAFSLHKLGGPSGMGVLYGRKEILDEMDTFIVGGDTIRDTFCDRPPIFLPPPHKYEAGLQDYAGMIASGAAIEYLNSLDMQEIHAHEIELNRYLSHELERFEEVQIIGPRDPALRGGILTFVVRKPGLGDLAERLDQQANIAVRSGLFCVNSWFNARSINKNLAATRISLYMYNTLDECRVFVRTLESILLDPIYEGLPLLPVKENA